MELSKIKSELNKLDLSKLITQEIAGNELLLTLKPTYPAMINKLVVLKFKRRGSAAMAVEMLAGIKEEQRRDAIREHRREEASAGNI